ncbi:hypothetical protein FYJ34_12475 [Clostridiaceae bacterium 68-1-5]|uniref:Uncharacterized protein n=1 Tax=Suipraeoptans intestinalis TaxID=2606628 RepID=A0A6N7V489_9FIRM|nr:hypothetical protein [Suipraeoptans intestinalis]MSR94940.1 hypothetical protein [Suipraeoptans intestinalis]
MWLEHENDVLTVKGWIFSPQQELKQVGLIVRDGKTEHRIDGHYRLKRTDVYQEFRMDNAKNVDSMHRHLWRILKHIRCGSHMRKEKSSIKYIWER